MGGIKLLFPLFTHMDMDIHTRAPAPALAGAGADPAEAGSARGLDVAASREFLLNLLAMFQQALQSKGNLGFMKRNGGFGVMQLLLRQCSPLCFSVDTVSHVSDLGNSQAELKYLSPARPNQTASLSLLASALNAIG